MKKVLKELYNKIKKDATYIIILIAPLLFAILIKIMIPLFDRMHNYLKLFDILIALVISISVALTISLFIVDELSLKGNKLLYTNNKINKYLNIRLFIGLIGTTIYIFLIQLVFSLSSFRITDIIILSILNAVVSLFLILMTITYANTKEQTFKYISLSSILVLASILPFVVLTPKIFYFGVVPTLWISKYFYGFYPIYPFGALMISSIWIIYFKIKFYIKHK